MKKLIYILWFLATIISLVFVFLFGKLYFEMYANQRIAWSLDSTVYATRYPNSKVISYRDYFVKGSSNGNRCIYVSTIGIYSEDSIDKIQTYYKKKFMDTRGRDYSVQVSKVIDPEVVNNFLKNVANADSSTTLKDYYYLIRVSVYGEEAFMDIRCI